MWPQASCIYTLPLSFFPPIASFFGICFLVYFLWKIPSILDAFEQKSTSSEDAGSYCKKIRVFKPHMANCLLTPLSSVIVQFVLLTQQGELEILKFSFIFSLFIFKGESKRWLVVFFLYEWGKKKVNILFGLIFLRNWGLKYAATSLVLESKHSLHYGVVWEGIEIATRPFTT